MRKSCGAWSTHVLADAASEASGALGSTAGGATVGAGGSTALGGDAGAEVARLEELGALGGKGDGELAVTGVGADAAHAAPDATTARATTASTLLMAGFLSHARSRHGVAFALSSAGDGPGVLAEISQCVGRASGLRADGRVAYGTWKTTR